jgi:glyoxylase-like metal-dependent hydrolase (beta-lactamase superfamily II)
MKRNGKLFESKHFRLQQVADGIYAALHTNGGWAISNAGIVDLGDRTLIFDTFLTPRAAADLRAAAESLTGRPVGIVVNSHYHNDHIWGNQVFCPDADIVATARTRHQIQTTGMVEYAWYKENSAPRLKALKSEYRAAREDEGKRQQLVLWIGYYEGLLASFQELDIRLPNITFVDNMEIHGLRRSVQLIPTSGGHTQSDAMLYIPSESVIFMSDLLFVGCHPYLSESDPDKLNSILETTRAIKPKTIIPGHGPVGTLDHLKQMQRYVQNLERLAEKAYKAGKPEEKLARTSIPAAFTDWEMPRFFVENLRFLYQRLANNEENEQGP